jgi:hypothetical protein
VGWVGPVLKPTETGTCHPVCGFNLPQEENDRKRGGKERGSTVAVKMASECGGGIAGGLEVELEKVYLIPLTIS